METHTTRRTAIATMGAGMAGLAAIAMTARGASAAMSSAAGVAAGGSLEGPGGTIQFSAFGSRMEFDDATGPIFQGSLAWHDPAGPDGAPVTIALAGIEFYGPTDLENERRLIGTVTVNGEGAYPAALTLVENGAVGEAADTVHLVVGTAVAELTGTPTAADADISFAYDVEGPLTTGDINLVAVANG